MWLFKKPDFVECVFVPHSDITVVELASIVQHGLKIISPIRVHKDVFKTELARHFHIVKGKLG